MPTTSSRRKRVPKYVHFRPRNLAKVTIDGRTIYLCEYGSKESKERYQELLAQWYEDQDDDILDAKTEICVCELILAYLRHCRDYYRKNGKLTREYGLIVDALGVVREEHDLTRVTEFGPRALRSVQDEMVRKDWCRKHINKQIGRIVRMFRWGVSEQLVRPSTWQALRSVRGLKAGRTKARETSPVAPVSDDIINATLVELDGTIVGDMVRIHRLLGCRPCELCGLRPELIDRTGEVWIYTPDDHKTSHQGKHRQIYIGPQAQRILMKYLLRASDAYCFDPREAPAARGNAKECYTKDSYGRAVRRAAERAGVETWSPNRLRHTRATEVRHQFGLEASQVTLGHATVTSRKSTPSVTASSRCKSHASPVSVIFTDAARGSRPERHQTRIAGQFNLPEVR